MYEKRINDYVFPWARPRWPDVEQHDAEGPQGNSGDPTLTVGGLRGTFRTWAQDETDFEEEDCRALVHHITGDDAEKAYKHGQALRKRRIVRKLGLIRDQPPAKLIAAARAALMICAHLRRKDSFLSIARRQASPGCLQIGPRDDGARAYFRAFTACRELPCT